MESIECWYDVETTGLDVSKGACVIQFACQIVENGEVVHEVCETINPYSYNREVTISEEALKINGFRQEDFELFKPLELVVKELIHLLAVKYPKKKLTLVGYNNSTFDKYFIEDMFKDQGKRFDLYFNWKQIDVFEIVKYLQHIGFMTKTFNQKLGTVAEYLNLAPEGSLHDALVDVKLTRGIHNKIKEALL